MTKLEEAYCQIGGDWEGVTKRLMGESLVQRFVKKFIEEDKSFCQLKEALSVGDAKAAFMAAHTLKGVCQSLGLMDCLSQPMSLLSFYVLSLSKDLMCFFLRLRSSTTVSLKVLLPVYRS